MMITKNPNLRMAAALGVLIPMLAGIGGCERELFTQKDDVASQRSLYWGEQHSVWNNAQSQHQQDQMPIPIGSAVSGY
jgi:hypothetical protein